MATHEPRATQKVITLVATHAASIPPGNRYGLWMSGWEYLSLRIAGKINTYEISVVEIAMSSTTWNVESAPLLKNPIATKQNTVETIPDNTFTRTGVPNRLLKPPKKRQNAPSYAATAWTRSEPIIQTAPDVT